MKHSAPLLPHRPPSEAPDGGGERPGSSGCGPAPGAPLSLRGQSSAGGSELADTTAGWRLEGTGRPHGGWVTTGFKLFKN